MVENRAKKAGVRMGETFHGEGWAWLAIVRWAKNWKFT